MAKLEYSPKRICLEGRLELRDREKPIDNWLDFFERLQLVTPVMVNGCFVHSLIGVALDIVGNIEECNGKRIVRFIYEEIE